MKFGKCGCDHARAKHHDDRGRAPLPPRGGADVGRRGAARGLRPPGPGRGHRARRAGAGAGGLEVPGRPGQPRRLVDGGGEEPRHRRDPPRADRAAVRARGGRSPVDRMVAGADGGVGVRGQGDRGRRAALDVRAVRRPPAGRDAGDGHPEVPLRLRRARAGAGVPERRGRDREAPRARARHAAVRGRAGGARRRAAGAGAGARGLPRPLPDVQRGVPRQPPGGGGARGAVRRGAAAGVAARRSPGHRRRRRGQGAPGADVSAGGAPAGPARRARRSDPPRRAGPLPLGRRR